MGNKSSDPYNRKDNNKEHPSYLVPHSKNKKNIVLDLNKNKWHTTHTSPGLLSTKDSTLYLNPHNIKESHLYISYLEKNLNFSTPPNSDCGIYPGKAYSIDFYGDIDKGAYIELFLIYYKQQIKVDMKSFRINHPSSVMIDNDIEQIRIALRISGKGTSLIKKIQFNTLDNNHNSLINSSASTPPSMFSSDNNDTDNAVLITKLIKDKENLEKDFKEALEFISKNMREQERLLSFRNNELSKYKSKYKSALKDIANLEKKIKELKNK